MRLELDHHHTKRDLGCLLDLSYAAVNCDKHDQLKLAIKRLSDLFPSESSLYARGNIKTLYDDVPKAEIVNVSYPEGYLDVYFENQFHKTDAVMWEFLSTLQPVSWMAVDCELYENYPSSVMADDFGMNNGWTHGVLDIQTMDCYFFFFSSAFQDGHDRTGKIVKYIVPFFAEVHKRISSRPQSNGFSLTFRETEVLNWLKEGKGSWEISAILNCSKRTVDFHVTNMKRKLGAMNRAQLVAIALIQGLIKF